MPADWSVPLQELQEENQSLRDCIALLEAQLAECQRVLQAQTAQRYSQADPLIQQSDERTATSEQPLNPHPPDQSESCLQIVQRQQILVDMLTGQLRTSQEYAAQLERQCTLTQQRYTEQVHALLQAENRCRDLSARLQRQQQYVLQFKTALEKSLNLTLPCNLDATAAPALDNIDRTLPESNQSQSHPVRQNGDSKGHVLKTQPIQPWSEPSRLTQSQLDSGQGTALFSKLQITPPATSKIEPSQRGQSVELPPFFSRASAKTSQPTPPEQMEQLTEQVSAAQSIADHQAASTSEGVTQSEQLEDSGLDRFNSEGTPPGCI